MKYIVVRGPPVHIIKTSGAFTTITLANENCPDFQKARRKTPSQYVMPTPVSDTNILKSFESRALLK